MPAETPKTRQTEPPGRDAPHAAAPVTEGLYCPDCGYDLRGLPAVRCPECGLSVETLLVEPGLPWIQRREMGLFRAYWQTVWTVTFRPKRLAREILRPVDYRAAQRFRWITILHAAAPLFLATAFAYVFATAEVEKALAEVGIGNLLVSFALYSLFLIAATGLPSYLFHPRWLPIELQNRAVAMSYYTCAALAWLWLPFAIGAAGMLTFDLLGDLGTLLILLALLLTLLSFVIWWVDLERLAKRVLRRPGRVVGVAIGVPLLWLLAAALILVALPAAVLFVLTVYHSLT